MLHANVLEKRMTACGDDPEVLEMIGDCVRDFSAYHAAEGGDGGGLGRGYERLPTGVGGG